MSKGDVEYIVLIFTVVITMLMIAVVAPLVSEMSFDAELNAIHSFSMNQYKANTVAATLVQQEGILNRTYDYPGWRDELETKRQEKQQIENRLDSIRGDHTGAGGWINDLEQLVPQFREYDLEPDAELGDPEASYSYDEEELIQERNQAEYLLEDNTRAYGDVFGKVYRKKILEEEITELENRIERLREDVRGNMSSWTDSYRYEYRINDEGERRTVFEEREEGGSREFTRIKLADPSEKEHYILLGVKR